MNFIEAMQKLKNSDPPGLITRPCFLYAHLAKSPIYWSYGYDEDLNVYAFVRESLDPCKIKNAQYLRGPITNLFNFLLCADDFLSTDWEHLQEQS